MHRRTTPRLLALGPRAGQRKILKEWREFEVPQWRALEAGLRPPPREPEEFEPGCQRAGWQHETSSRVEREFRRNSVLNRMSGRDRALLRSQSGPVAGVSLSSTPSSPLTRMEPALFRVLLQRRLALPLPISNRTCRCGRPLDAFGHHRAACARSGVLGRRGFALESAAGRVCREAGTRVGWPQTSSSEIWILECPMPTITGGWRLLPTACHCLAGSNSPWTQPSSLQFG